MRARILIGVVAIITTAYGKSDCELGGSPRDSWPAVPVFTNTAAINQAVAEYHRQGWDWRIFAATGPYRRGGDYLNWAGAVWSPIRWSTTTNDVNGVILQTYDSGATYVFQPVTVAQYALWLWSDYTHGNELSPLFRVNADALLSGQLPNGAIPFNFDLNWVNPLKSGWVSGMAQGQAISVFTRAYKEFGDERYKDAARRASEFMLTPVSAGGCLNSLGDLNPSLARFEKIQEYPYKPDTFTLNGSCFAVLGLYDWLEYDESLQCTFDRTIETIRYLLSYYNLGGFSSYNLQHMQGRSPEIQPPYHAFNTMLIWALDSIAPHPALNLTWRTWASYVGQTMAQEQILRITRTGTSIVISGFASGDSLETTERFTTWQRITLPAGTESVTFPATNDVGFFRLAR